MKALLNQYYASVPGALLDGGTAPFDFILIALLAVLVLASLFIFWLLWKRHKQTTLLYKPEKLKARIGKAANGKPVMTVTARLRNICANNIVMEILSVRAVTEKGSEFLRKEVALFEHQGVNALRHPLAIGGTIEFKHEFYAAEDFVAAAYKYALLTVRVTSAEILPYEKYHLVILS